MGQEEYLREKEWECYLRGKISEYAYHTPLTASEYRGLLDWMLEGHCLHTNPFGLTNAEGKPMDYIKALRVEKPL